MGNQSAYELNQLAGQCSKRGDYRGCINWAEQAEVQARRDGETRQELSAITSQATAWGNMGEEKKSLKAATRLMARARQTEQEEYLMKGTRGFASRVAFIDLRNRWREIRPLLLEGVELARRRGDTDEEVRHLQLLGNYAVKVGELEQGYAWLQEALNAVRPGLNSADYFRYYIYTSLSVLMRKREDHAEAVRYAEMSVGAAEQNGNPEFVAGARLRLAQAERARGELGAALAIVEKLLPVARERGWQKNEQRVEYLRGEIERVLGHPDTAVEAARRALELAQAREVKEEEVECMLSLGRALGERAEAVEVLQCARRLCQERDYADHFDEVEELLRQGASE